MELTEVMYWLVNGGVFGASVVAIILGLWLIWKVMWLDSLYNKDKNNMRLSLLEYKVDALLYIISGKKVETKNENNKEN